MRHPINTAIANTAALNPFSLMMEPERVLQTMERSAQLRALKRHKLHPLDKPLIPLTKAASAQRAAFANEMETKRIGRELAQSLPN